MPVFFDEKGVEKLGRSLAIINVAERPRCRLAAYTVRDLDGLNETHLDRLIEAQLRDDSWLPPVYSRTSSTRIGTRLWADRYPMSE